MEPQVISRSGLESEVQSLLSELLDTPPGDAEPDWDSFTHVEIVVMVEDHFKLRFDRREIAGIRNARDIVRVLEARLAP